MEIKNTLNQTVVCWEMDINTKPAQEGWNIPW